jgi:hypothetical protein
MAIVETTRTETKEELSFCGTATRPRGLARGPVRRRSWTPASLCPASMQASKFIFSLQTCHDSFWADGPGRRRCSVTAIEQAAVEAPRAVALLAAYVSLQPGQPALQVPSARLCTLGAKTRGARVLRVGYTLCLQKGLPCGSPCIRSSCSRLHDMCVSARIETHDTRPCTSSVRDVAPQRTNR